MQRLLVIDDDELTLQAMQGILQDEGYEVIATADGPRGIMLYKEHRPGLVLLDIGLPSMNGLEVLRRIKGIDRNARIIVITGLGTEESQEVATRYGAIDFLRKPVRAPLLVEKISTALAS